MAISLSLSLSRQYCVNVEQNVNWTVFKVRFGRILIRIFSPDLRVRSGYHDSIRITIITTPLKFLPLRIKRFSYTASRSNPLPLFSGFTNYSQRPLSPQPRAVCHDSAVPQVTAIYGAQLRLSTFLVYTLASAANAKRKKLEAKKSKAKWGPERERE